MAESRWKQLLPYAIRYDVQARGFGPQEVAEQIVDKARKGRIDLSDEEYEEIVDIAAKANGNKGGRDKLLDRLNNRCPVCGEMFDSRKALNTHKGWHKRRGDDEN